MSTTTDTTHLGSDLVAAIEKFWSSLREWHSELPANIVVITGSGRERGGLRRGHFAAGQWTTEGGRAHELFISGERIADGGRGIATTVIHEAAHALLLARGDTTMGTSRQFRYHTRSGFAAAAEELGLTAPVKAHPVLGFSDCTMPDITAEMYAADIEALDAAIGARIHMVTDDELIGAAYAVGALLGGLNVVLPWWVGGQAATTWGELGGIVARTPKPRQRRRPPVTFACDCRSFTVPAAEAHEHEDLTCGRCGFPMMAS